MRSVCCMLLRFGVLYVSQECGVLLENCHTRVCFNPICAYNDAACRIKCRALLQGLAMHRLPTLLQSPDLLRMSVPSRSLVSSLRRHCSIQHLPCNLQSQSSAALYSDSSRYASHRIQALSQRMLFLSSCQFLQKSCSRRRLPCNMQPRYLSVLYQSIKALTLPSLSRSKLRCISSSQAILNCLYQVQFFTDTVEKFQPSCTHVIHHDAVILVMNINAALYYPDLGITLCDTCSCPES